MPVLIPVCSQAMAGALHGERGVMTPFQIVSWLLCGWLESRCQNLLTDDTHLQSAANSAIYLDVLKQG